MPDLDLDAIERRYYVGSTWSVQAQMRGDIQALLAECRRLRGILLSPHERMEIDGYVLIHTADAIHVYDYTPPFPFPPVPEGSEPHPEPCG